MSLLHGDEDVGNLVAYHQQTIILLLYHVDMPTSNTIARCILVSIFYDRWRGRI